MGLGQRGVYWSGYVNWQLVTYTGNSLLVTHLIFKISDKLAVFAKVSLYLDFILHEFDLNVLSWKYGSI